MTLNSRQQLRKTLRQQRQSLSIDAQTVAADLLSQRLETLKFIQQSNNIAMYLASDGEISLAPAIELAWQLGKNVYLPVVSEEQGQMNFVPYDRATILHLNRYGIAEPSMDELSTTLLDASELDLVLMPLVGFDRHGARLGMGGGYYDRAFAFMQGPSTELTASKFKIPKLIGVAHSIQEVDTLDTASWDIPLDGIITDQTWIETHIEP